jgi:UDP-N-acetylglucosamine diphosphorylase/glucosamine-1-phosphate N-acetyltransferase
MSTSVNADIAAIILAAGRGVRMQSDLPKVFHNLFGKPMLESVLNTVKSLGISKIFVVVGHKKELITEYFKDWPITFVNQDQQLGTGHAVRVVEPYLKDFSGTVLVLAGDVPLLSQMTLKKLLEFHLTSNAAATDLTADLPDAGNYGRILRDKTGQISKIVEKKDATPEELKLTEINTGTFCFNSKDLFSSLAKVRSENAQKEYYLTDTIEILKSENKPVFGFKTSNYKETLGVNTKEELAAMGSNAS